MDGSFACPECGTDVEVRGLAPGRQVRCGFCHRLLEVPYLPRAADALVETPAFRAAEMGPAWAWVGPGCCSFCSLGCWSPDPVLLSRQYDSFRERSINRLLESSRGHEAGGPARRGPDRSRRSPEARRKGRPGVAQARRDRASQPTGPRPARRRREFWPG